MLAKRDAMRDQGSAQEPDTRRKGRARGSDEDSDDGGGGGRGAADEEKDTTDRRRRRALEGSSKAAAVKPSRQASCHDCALV